MSYDPHKHHRRSIRLKGYDYSSEGAYFVTVCVKGGQCLLGEIVDGEMVLNEYGRVVEAYWYDLENHYGHVVLDAFVIMPNHFHFIIIFMGLVGSVGLEGTDVGADVGCRGGSQTRPYTRPYRCETIWLA